MKRFSRMTIFLLLASSTSACAAERKPAAAPVQAMAAAAGPALATAMPAPIATPPPAPVTTALPTATAPATATATKAKNAGPTTRAPVVIFQGDVKMLTEEEAIPKTIDRIVDLAEQAGGHIAARKDLSVQVKVPSAKFRETLSKIDEIGGVTSRSVQADDVSEEFHDLEVRLTNLRATRARLQDFMAKATNVNEMLVVERELERIAQEVDKIEGRLEFLRTRAAMSTIAVAFTAKPKPVAPIAAVTPAAPTTPRRVELPIGWMNDVGIDRVMSLKK
jgi:hypothetical protein